MTLCSLKSLSPERFNQKCNLTEVGVKTSVKRPGARSFVFINYWVFIDAGIKYVIISYT